MSIPRLGRVQLRIMQFLWDRGRATARDITEALSREKPIAHSTVQTLLRKLEAKGAVGHEVAGRTFVFRALIQPESVVRKVTREFVDRLFAGSPGGLVAYLLRHERIPREELAGIRRLIDEASPGTGTQDGTRLRRGN